MAASSGRAAVEAARARLLSIRPELEKMMSAAGTVGLSYGVILHGELVLTDNLGFRDLENKTAPDEETIFPICSMTKGLVSSLVGMFVEEGKLDFDDRISDLLPSYDPKTNTLKESARLSDWMSMQSGTEPYQAWFHSQNNIVFKKEDAMKIINSLEPVTDLRTKFSYSNWGYEVAAQIIHHLTGETWDSLLHSRIFEPLGLGRTDAKGALDDVDNVAKAYTVLDDGTPVNIRRTPISGATILGAGGGVHSCIKDLLVLYKEILRASVDQFNKGNTSTSGSVFQRLTTTMSAHSKLPGPSFRESTYGLGWLRTQLPNQMCKISPNLVVLGDEPVLGEDSTPRLLVAHYGSMPGAYCGVNLFPESDALVVVLSNSTPMCDMADWSIQLITQTLFDFPVKHDYFDWVRRTVDKELEWYPNTKSALEDRKAHGTKPRPLEQYVGEYRNEGDYFTISVFAKGENGLYMQLQGLEEEVYQLEHYEHDTFCWLQPRNELVSRGRWVLQEPEYFLFSFQALHDSETIDRFAWVNDPGVPKGEVFVKVN